MFELSNDDNVLSYYGGEDKDTTIVVDKLFFGKYHEPRAFFLLSVNRCRPRMCVFNLSNIIQNHITTCYV